MKIWIDTASGTWGAAKSMVVVDLENPELHDGDTDAVSLELFLDAATDSEIQDFGLRYGKKVVE